MTYDSTHQAHAFLYARIKLTMNRLYTEQIELKSSLAKTVYLHLLSDSLIFILTHSLTTPALLLTKQNYHWNIFLVNITQEHLT